MNGTGNSATDNRVATGTVGGGTSCLRFGWSIDAAARRTKTSEVVALKAEPRTRASGSEFGISACARIAAKTDHIQTTADLDPKLNERSLPLVHIERGCAHPNQRRRSTGPLWLVSGGSREQRGSSAIGASTPLTSFVWMSGSGRRLYEAGCLALVIAPLRLCDACASQARRRGGGACRDSERCRSQRSGHPGCPARWSAARRPDRC